jgi:hypothetical protein
MTQANDLPSRMNRAEDNVIDLKLAVSTTLQAIDKNSEDIAQLIEVSRYTLEVSRRNSEAIVSLREGTAALQLAQIRTEAALQVFQQHTDAAIERHDAAIERHDALIERLTASNERTEQLLEYVIRRDRGQLE